MKREDFFFVLSFENDFLLHSKSSEQERNTLRQINTDVSRINGDSLLLFHLFALEPEGEVRNIIQ